MLGNIVLGETGGDGGYATTSSGEFINDSTYMKHTIETFYDKEKENENIIREIRERITIHSDGKIETDTLKKFIKDE